MCAAISTSSSSCFPFLSSPRKAPRGPAPPAELLGVGLSGGWVEARDEKGTGADGSASPGCDSGMPPEARKDPPPHVGGGAFEGLLEGLEETGEAAAADLERFEAAAAGGPYASPVKGLRNAAFT